MIIFLCPWACVPSPFFRSTIPSQRSRVPPVPGSYTWNTLPATLPRVPPSPSLTITLTGVPVTLISSSWQVFHDKRGSNASEYMRLVCHEVSKGLRCTEVSSRCQWVCVYVRGVGLCVCIFYVCIWMVCVCVCIFFNVSIHAFLSLCMHIFCVAMHIFLYVRVCFYLCVFL